MKKVIKLVVFSVVILGLLICAGVIYDGYQLYTKKTEEISLEDMVSSIKAKDNYLSYDDIPDDFVKALIAIEDHRFFEHNGVDLIAIARAFLTDIKQMELVEGGSTITQQLAKNLYYTQEKSFSRKVAEVFTAFELEKKYSKEDIIEIYINIVYFGDGYYGIVEAANGYFSKDVKDLSLYEITLLAGLPNAPSVYALSNDNELALQRQIQVIDAMVEYDYLDENMATELKNTKQ